MDVGFRKAAPSEVNKNHKKWQCGASWRRQSRRKTWLQRNGEILRLLEVTHATRLDPSPAFGGLSPSGIHSTKIMKTTTLPTSIGLATIACASLGAALAGSPASPVTAPPMQTPPSAASPWEFRIEPYIWLPSLNGTVGVRGRTTDIDMDLSDLFDSDSGSGGNTFDLNMLFAMQLEVRNGRWGILADGAYVDLDVSGSAPGIRHLAANVDYTEFLGDLVAAYRLTDKPCGFLDLYAGARFNSLSLDLHAQADLVRFPREPSINDSQSETWVDPIIGLRGQWHFTERCFLAGKADIGGFGVSSDFLWSAQATVGYQFTDWFSTEIGYRYYDTDYVDSGFTYDMAMGGLFLGFDFKF